MFSNNSGAAGMLFFCIYVRREPMSSYHTKQKYLKTKLTTMV